MKPLRRTYGPTPMTGPKAERALSALLRDCRPEMLATFTAEGLAGSYRVAPAKCAEMLAAARRRRVG